MYLYCSLGGVLDQVPNLGRLCSESGPFRSIFPLFLLTTTRLHLLGMVDLAGKRCVFHNWTPHISIEQDAAAPPRPWHTVKWVRDPLSLKVGGSIMAVPQVQRTWAARPTVAYKQGEPSAWMENAHEQGSNTKYDQNATSNDRQGSSMMDSHLLASSLGRSLSISNVGWPDWRR